MSMHKSEHSNIAVEQSKDVSSSTPQCCVRIKQSERFFLLLFYWNVFSSCVSFALVMPSLWPYLDSMHASEWFMSVCVALYSLGELLGSLLIGRAYNVFGAKPTLVFSITCGLCGSLMYACAGLAKSRDSGESWGPWMVLIGRFLQGAWTGGEQAVESAFIAEHIAMSKRTAIMTTLQGFASAGFILGPAIGTPLEEFTLDIGTLHFDSNMIPGVFISVAGVLMLTLTVVLFDPHSVIHQQNQKKEQQSSSVMNRSDVDKNDDDQSQSSLQTLTLGQLTREVHRYRQLKLQQRMLMVVDHESSKQRESPVTVTVECRDSGDPNSESDLSAQRRRSVTPPSDTTPLIRERAHYGSAQSWAQLAHHNGPNKTTNSVAKTDRNDVKDVEHSGNIQNVLLHSSSDLTIADERDWDAPNLTGLMVCCLAFFVHFEGFAVQETMTTVLVETEFGWSETDSNLLFTAAGVGSLLTLLVLWLLTSGYLPWLMKASNESNNRNNDFKLVLISLLIGAVGHLSLIDWPFLDHYNSSLFLIGFTLITLAFPFGRSVVLSMYSKVVGPLPQGSYMGWIFTCGAISRIVAPLCAVQLFTSNGPTLLFAFSGALFLLCIGLFLGFPVALQPHVQLALFESLIKELTCDEDDCDSKVIAKTEDDSMSPRKAAVMAHRPKLLRSTTVLDILNDGGNQKANLQCSSPLVSSVTIPGGMASSLATLSPRRSSSRQSTVSVTPTPSLDLRRRRSNTNVVSIHKRQSSEGVRRVMDVTSTMREAGDSQSATENAPSIIERSQNSARFITFSTDFFSPQTQLN